MTVLPLHTNMRVQRVLAAGGPGAAQRAADLQAWADWLLRIGDGIEPTYPAQGEGYVNLPPGLLASGPTLKHLIADIYGDMPADPQARAQFLSERAILAPLNADVDELNRVIDEAFPLPAVAGQPPERRTYHSTDGIADADGDGPGGAAALYPVEFLNSINLSGLPPHIIHLQVGAPIILLRNLTAGLANGTRLIVTRLMPRVIEAEVVTGPARGRRMMIPRLRITPSDTQRLPFTIARTQFPARPAFAMTINKAQGQTFSKVGILTSLTTPQTTPDIAKKRAGPVNPSLCTHWAAAAARRLASQRLAAA